MHLPVSFGHEAVALQISSPITAAGPLPISTGFPIKPQWAPFEYKRLSDWTIFVNRLFSSFRDHPEFEAFAF